MLQIFPTFNISSIIQIPFQLFKIFRRCRDLFNFFQIIPNIQNFQTSFKKYSRLLYQFLQLIQHCLMNSFIIFKIFKLYSKYCFIYINNGSTMFHIFKIASAVSSLHSALFHEFIHNIQNIQTSSIHTYFLQEMHSLVILYSSYRFWSSVTSSYFTLFKQFIYQNVQILQEMMGPLQFFSNYS